MIGLGAWFFLRRKRTSAGPDYAAAPSVEERSEGGVGGAGRYSGYGMGGMGGGGYTGGYTDERSPSNEDGIPMKYYVSHTHIPYPSYYIHSHAVLCALPTYLPQDPSDPSTYPGMTSPTSPGPSGPSIHTTNNAIDTTSNAGSARPFSQNISTYGGVSHYNGLPEV